MQPGKRRMIIWMAFLGLVVKDDLKARERKMETKNRTIDLYVYTQNYVIHIFMCDLMKLSVMIWMYRIYPLPQPLKSSLTVRYNFINLFLKLSICVASATWNSQGRIREWPESSIYCVSQSAKGVVHSYLIKVQLTLCGVGIKTLHWEDDVWSLSRNTHRHDPDGWRG